MRPQATRIAIALSASAAIALPAAALAGSGAGGMASNGAAEARIAGVHTVLLKNIHFNPATLAIRRGESVMWVWRDGSTEHNVTTGGFHSRTQARGSFTVRFTRAGTFNYRCTIHVAEGMKGKVVVH